LAKYLGVFWIPNRIRAPAHPGQNQIKKKMKTSVKETRQEDKTRQDKTTTRHDNHKIRQPQDKTATRQDN
jgi:hypothetical protein